MKIVLTIKSILHLDYNDIFVLEKTTMYLQNLPRQHRNYFSRRQYIEKDSVSLQEYLNTRYTALHVKENIYQLIELVL
jgi:hypothetical protein